ncbi:MAG: FapA family protein [Chloroflexi bacterium]|nr:FapA family protein [Chloroflexota bacterium]
MSVETTASATGVADSNGSPIKPQTRKIVVEVADEASGRAEAAKQLGVPPDELTLHIVSRRKRGFLGIGGEILQLEATWQPPVSPAAGRIELSCLMGIVSMRVVPPEGRGLPADQAVLEALLKDWPLDARDDTVAGAALRAADGTATMFGAISPSAQPPDGSGVAVKVSADDFTSWLIPWADAEIDRNSVEAALAAAGITAGIDTALLERLAGSKLTSPVVIARGKPPKDGVDAAVEYVVKEMAAERKQAGGDGDERKPAVDENERVDYREIGGIPMVLEGDVLVRKIAAVPPEPGYTVRGKTLPAKPAKDLDLRRLAGQNTAVSDSQIELIAKIGGLPSRTGDRIAVTPVFSVQGDVDFKTGNLNFTGNVNVSGGVKPGFKLRATGDITIGGTIDAAELIEAGGTVTINSGVIGQGRTVIRAGGAFSARFVDQAEIHAGGPVTVAREIRHSTVISEVSVTVPGTGRIVGGLVRGRNFVEAGVLGSPASTPTFVQAGWGEEMLADLETEQRIPRVIARSEVNPGVIVNVAGAAQKMTQTGPGGVWRQVDGRIQYSAS